mmetsp:Transcript_15721/g.36209  ORF Transcript_15721/g.36209 Transcript_15721/m.36209 type:complete len:372 (-) Transcript_15721:15-1130(-)
MPDGSTSTPPPGPGGDGRAGHAPRSAPSREPEPTVIRRIGERGDEGPGPDRAEEEAVQGVCIAGNSDRESQEGQQALPGKWKNGIFRCDPSSFCCSLFCSLYVLGDVQTRAHMSIFGGVLEDTVPPTYGFWMVGVFVCSTTYQLVVTVMGVIVIIAGPRNDDEEYEFMTLVMTFAYLSAVPITFIFFLCAVSKTRRTIRMRREIPGSALEDSCLAAFCTPCVLAQVDREVSQQIEAARSESWREEELELQRKRKREVIIEDGRDIANITFGANVCKVMVVLFASSVVSLIVIGIRVEDQIHFLYIVVIAVLLVIALCAATLICFIIWSIRRCWRKCRNRGSQIQFDSEINIESDRAAAEEGHHQEDELEII